MMFSSRMQSLSRLRLIWPVLSCGIIYSPAMLAETLPADGTPRVYIGTYTGAKSKGIYFARFDPATAWISSRMTSVGAALVRARCNNGLLATCA